MPGMPTAKVKIKINGAIAAGASFWAALAAGDDGEIEAVSTEAFTDMLSEMEVLSRAGWIRGRLGLTREQCADLGWMSSKVEHRADGRIRLAWTNAKGLIPTNHVGESSVWAWFVTFESDDHGGWQVSAVNDHEPGQAIDVEHPRAN